MSYSLTFSRRNIAASERFYLLFICQSFPIQLSDLQDGFKPYREKSDFVVDPVESQDHGWVQVAPFLLVVSDVSPEGSICSGL